MSNDDTSNLFSHYFQNDEAPFTDNYNISLFQLILNNYILYQGGNSIEEDKDECYNNYKEDFPKEQEYYHTFI
jgi:hypothetical protein